MNDENINELSSSEQLVENMPKHVSFLNDFSILLISIIGNEALFSTLNFYLKKGL